MISIVIDGKFITVSDGKNNVMSEFDITQSVGEILVNFNRCIAFQDVEDKEKDFTVVGKFAEKIFYTVMKEIKNRKIKDYYSSFEKGVYTIKLKEEERKWFEEFTDKILAAEI